MLLLLWRQVLAHRPQQTGRAPVRAGRQCRRCTKPGDRDIGTKDTRNQGKCLLGPSQPHVTSSRSRKIEVAKIAISKKSKFLFCVRIDTICTSEGRKIEFIASKDIAKMTNQPERGERPFPRAGIDGFLSHFIFSVRVNAGDLAGQVFAFTWPSAIQTVVRSEPFVYQGRQARHQVEFPLPQGSQLPRNLSEEEFVAIPPGFFEEGKETIWLQILNLDARAQTDLGPIRSILGETFNREYPDIFQPSFGAAQSLGERGLPGRLFFSPCAIFETPFGAFRTRAKALLGSRIESIPPVGSNPELLGAVPLDSVEQLRAARPTPGNAAAEAVPEQAAATLLALAHPIDAELQAEDAFQAVESAIART